ncbi:hypothetical protein PLANPX_2166 [Lacipirellula parvula]|uniref:Uncharacterized protein n=1 Tax=Lacipirellula parvula TaxID=2650471 RepID=A0A5K7X743_9BACT|nr:hypothetical protein PLANPX_2166 [Lacipirellula parvula]
MAFRTVPCPAGDGVDCRRAVAVEGATMVHRPVLPWLCLPQIKLAGRCGRRHALTLRENKKKAAPSQKCGGAASGS